MDDFQVGLSHRKDGKCADGCNRIGKLDGDKIEYRHFCAHVGIEPAKKCRAKGPFCQQGGVGAPISLCSSLLPSGKDAGAGLLHIWGIITVDIVFLRRRSPGP